MLAAGGAVVLEARGATIGWTPQDMANRGAELPADQARDPRAAAGAGDGAGDGGLVLQDVNLSVGRGVLFGVLGAVATGKSTLMAGQEWGWPWGDGGAGSGVATGKGTHGARGTEG